MAKIIILDTDKQWHVLDGKTIVGTHKTYKAAMRQVMRGLGLTIKQRGQDDKD